MTQRPNFLFIFPDQWRGDCLSILGHPVVETPFLDNVAAEGTLFTSGYTPSPSCIPARVCLATGMNPSSTGRLGYKDRVPWEFKNTLMRVLRDNDYQTLMVGKTHFFPQRLALGFEEMRLCEVRTVEEGFKSDYHAWLEKETSGKIQDTSEIIGPNSWIPHPWTYPEYYHPTNWTTDNSIELLSRRDPTRPFFLQVNYHRPHPPIDPPQHYYERFLNKPLPPVPIGDWADEFDVQSYDVNLFFGHLPDHALDRSRRAYYAQLAHLDVQIGRLLLYMRKHGLLDNTYVIFSSDHGELLGDHHLFRKFNAFEGSAKIPFFIKPPENRGEFKRGVVNDTAVSLVDVMPTLLEEAGIPIPPSVDGISLSPILRGAPIQRKFIHGEHIDHQPQLGAWQYLTDGHVKYIWETKSGKEYCFDLDADPQELVNLAARPEHADLVTHWRQRLIEILAQRPQDGLSDGKRLIPGKALPAIRPPQAN